MNVLCIEKEKTYGIMGRSKSVSTYWQADFPFVR